MKLMKRIAEGMVAAVVAIAGTTIAQPNIRNSNEENDVKMVGTADEVFDHAASFDGWKLYDFRDFGYETNDSYWCAWFASTMIMDCNVNFPVEDFYRRIWVADILAAYLAEGRYIHTASNTYGFVSEDGYYTVTDDMLLECQDTSYIPEHADLVFFDWDGDCHPEHIGFVDYLDSEGKIHTLEGNPGNAAYTETRVGRLTQDRSCIVGYAKPEYRPVHTSTSVEVIENVQETTPEPTMPEPTEPQTICISFDAAPGEVAEQERTIILGTCSINPFPTPSLPVPGAVFEGWFLGDTEITNNSALSESVVLSAHWSIPEPATEAPTSAPTEPPKEETDIIEVKQEMPNYSDQFNYTPEPEPIVAQSIVLNRTSKMLSCDSASNSRSFELIPEVLPLDAVDRNVVLVSSDPNVACVSGNTITAIHDGSCTITAYCGNASAVCSITVNTAYTTEYRTEAYSTLVDVPESYNCVCYCTRDAFTKVRQFSNESIGDRYDELNRDVVYGEWVHRYTYSASEVENAPKIRPGEATSGGQWGINDCGDTGHALMYGSDIYLFFIESINYKKVEQTEYRTITVRTPVHYD